MAEPDYTKTIQRLLDLLQADTEFVAKISELRFGELPEEHNANSYPVCYVTTSSNPEVSRELVGSASLGKLPAQRIKTEYWIVLVVNEATPADAQKRLYELRNDVIDILSQNTQLLDLEQKDPQCSNLEIDSIRRLTKQRGQMLDGITVIIQTTNYKNSPDIS